MSERDGPRSDTDSFPLPIWDILSAVHSKLLHRGREEQLRSAYIVITFSEGVLLRGASGAQSELEED